MLLHLPFTAVRLPLLAVTLLICLGQGLTQQSAVHVHVIDSNGYAVAGATVSTTSIPQIRAKTSSSGDADLLLPSPQTPLQASFGFLRSEVGIAASTNLELRLRSPQASETITVTATRSTGVAGDIAETTETLTQQTLRTFPSLTLDEGLRQHAGFELFRRASSRVANPTSEGISLRGLGSTAVSRTLVLQQSAPLNDAFGGWIHWNELPPSAVSAVTIATGGGSDLYGSSALGGVIDLVPAQPEKTLADLEASGAGQSTSDVSARVDRGTGLWRGTLAAQSFRTAGYIPTAPANAGPVDNPANVHFQNIHTEFDRTLGSSGRAFLTGNILNEARGNGTPLTTNGTRLWRYLAGDDWSAGPASGRIRAFGSNEGYRQSFSSIPASRLTETLTRRQRVRVQEIGASTDAAIHIGEFAFVAGADVRDLRATNKEFPIVAGLPAPIQDTSARQRFAGAFAEALYTHGPWSAAASVRLDHAANLDTTQKLNNIPTSIPDRAEFVANPRLGLVRRINERLFLRGAAFRAFRTPTINELYRQGQVGQEITQANASLLSERATGLEAGANFTSPSGRFTALATYFWTEINRPVSAVLISQTATSTLNKRQNLGQLRSQGLELRAEARIIRSITGTVGYQFADATITKFSAQPLLIGNRLPEVPRNAVTGQLRIATERLGNYTAALRRSGMVFDDTANTQILRGFFQADLYGERVLAGHYTVFAAVQNIFNQRADNARTPVLTLGCGIVAQAGIKLRWGGTT